MYKAALNAQLVKTWLKRAPQICWLRKITSVKNFGCHWKGWAAWLLLVKLVFRRYEFLVVFCMSFFIMYVFFHDAFLVAEFLVDAGLGQKKCGAGWDGVRDGCGLEVCRCGTGAGKISQTPAGAGRVQILPVRGGSGQKNSTCAGLQYATVNVFTATVKE